MSAHLDFVRDAARAGVVILTVIAVLAVMIAAGAMYESVTTGKHDGWVLVGLFVLVYIVAFAVTWVQTGKTRDELVKLHIAERDRQEALVRKYSATT